MRGSHLSFVMDATGADNDKQENRYAPPKRPNIQVSFMPLNALYKCANLKCSKNVFFLMHIGLSCQIPYRKSVLNSNFHGFQLTYHCCITKKFTELNNGDLSVYLGYRLTEVTLVTEQRVV